MDRGKSVHKKYAFSLALQHHYEGRLKEAEYGYQQILRAFPNNAAAHYNLGHTLQNQGKLDEAIASYRLANPDENENYGGFGESEIEPLRGCLNRIKDSPPVREVLEFLDNQVSPVPEE